MASLLLGLISQIMQKFYLLPRSIDLYEVESLAFAKTIIFNCMQFTSKEENKNRNKMLGLF